MSEPRLRRPTIARVERPGLPWAPPENPAHRSGKSDGDYQHSAPPCFGPYADYEGDPFTCDPWTQSATGHWSRRSGGGRGRGGMAPWDRDCDGAGETTDTTQEPPC